MAIVTDDVKLLVDFTNDKALLKKELDNLRGKRGRSDQYTALVATLNEMFDGEDIRPIVIFQTDGDELTSLKGSQQASVRPRKKFSLEDVYALVSKSRATVYSIISGPYFIGLSQEEQLAKMESLSNDDRKPSKDALMRGVDAFLMHQLPLFEIGKLSGGYTDFLEKPEDAENVYSNIFKVINNRYVIGYYPTNKETDGKTRHVKIEIRNYPEYVVMGRKDYFLSR